MNYFVTGATGFIGKRLVARLLARPDSVVYFLVRTVELPRLGEFREYWGVDETERYRSSAILPSQISAYQRRTSRN
jgi:uncharacterized protein YbjT (DUF2867 family)